MSATNARVVIGGVSRTATRPVTADESARLRYLELLRADYREADETVRLLRDERSDPMAIRHAAQRRNGILDQIAREA